MNEKWTRYAGQRQAAYLYVSEILNPLKKAYAQAYADWRDGVLNYGLQEAAPEAPAGLSAMAAQAVRLNLNEILS